MSLNGIIISSQSFRDYGPFPRPGGTAWGLNKITNLPRIRMHRNGKAREDEAALINKIDNNGLIFITGHGGDQVEDFRGLYTVSENESENTSIDFQWSIESYVNLLIDNMDIDKLKRQANSGINNTGYPIRPHINMVLWVCQGAKSDLDSSAAKMARLFADKGIDVSILANQDNTRRFNGKIDDNKILFHGNNDALRVFDCVNNKLTMNKIATSEAIYAHENGVTGFYSNKAAKLDESEKDKVEKATFSPEYFISLSSRSDMVAVDDREKIWSYLEEHPDKLVVATSNLQATNTNPDSYYVSLNFNDSQGKVQRFLFMLSSNGDIYSVAPNTLKTIKIKDLDACIRKLKSLEHLDDPISIPSEKIAVLDESKKNIDKEGNTNQNETGNSLPDEGLKNKQLDDDDQEDIYENRPIKATFLLSLFDSTFVKGAGILVAAIFLGVAAGVIIFSTLMPLTTLFTAAAIGTGVGLGVSLCSGTGLSLFACGSIPIDDIPFEAKPLELGTV